MKIEIKTMKRMLGILFFVMALLSPANLIAQPPVGGPGGGPGGPGGPGRTMQMQVERMKMAFITGNVYLSSEAADSVETPGVGVTVMVLGKKVNSSKVDTLYTTVNDKGQFMIGGLKPGDVYVRFSMLGYEELSRPMKLVEGPNKIIANMKLEKYSLNAAVKKETVNTVSVIGDTIVFHAAAVKVNKGENAIDVLEQMPGVEVSTSSVTVLGETVQNVYIDGALLFGNAPMKALNNLPAEEVVTIKSYQEYANKDPNHKFSKNESKERVLDISTKSKMKSMLMVNALAGAGFDTDSTYHKFRYTAGGSVALFSESLQTNIQFNLNNINDASVRQRGNSFRQANGGGSADLRVATLDANVNRNWMSKTHRNYVLGSIGGGYSYNDKYNVSESVSQRIYFPTDEYESRTSESSSYSATTDKQHSFNIRGMKALKDGNVSLGASYSLSDNLSDSRSQSYNYQDDLPKQGTSTSTHRLGDSHSYNVSLNANKGFWDKLRLEGGVSYSRGNSDAGSTKIDTTTSTITNTVLDITSNAMSHNFNVSPSIRYELTDRSSLSVGYSFSDSYNQSDQWAYDVTNPAASSIDTVNTQIRTNDNNSHSANVGFRTAFGKDDNIIFGTSLSYVSTGLNRSDAFPEDEPVYSRRFNALRPSVFFDTKSQINHWSASWNSSSNTPSIEQLRPKIDNTNLYNVSAGNPNLKQSTNNSFHFGYSTVLGKGAKEAMAQQAEDPMAAMRFGGPGGARRQERFISNQFATFDLSADFNLNNDVIVNKKTYFSEETYLADYDYTMPAQSTFSSYENASSAYSASLQARFGIPLDKIKCILSTNASVGWDKSPSYINSVLTQTENLSPRIGLGLRSNFSRNIRFNLNGNASYVHSQTSANDKTDYFTETVRAGFELNNVLKVMYLGGNYYKTFKQGISFTQINDNILDLNAGVRFGKQNNYDLSFKVHDLFNKTSGFSRSVQADCISNSWQHNFGRYVMFTFAYHFSSMGKRGFGGGPGGPGGGFGGPGGPGGGPGGF